MAGLAVLRPECGVITTCRGLGLEAPPLIGMSSGTGHRNPATFRCYGAAHLPPFGAGSRELHRRPGNRSDRIDVPWSHYQSSYAISCSTHL